MTGAGSRSIGRAGYGDPQSSGRSETSKERRAWEPAPRWPRRGGCSSGAYCSTFSQTKWTFWLLRHF